MVMTYRFGDLSPKIWLNKSNTYLSANGLMVNITEDILWEQSSVGEYISHNSGR